MPRRLFTSESVTEGHPDKICDKISDAVLDAIIAKDPKCRVACETLVKTGYVNLAGEVTTSTYVDLPKIVRDTVRRIGYVSSEMGFDADSCGVLVALEAQSPDISLGVDGKGVYSDEQGAGDQGMMFGYAQNNHHEDRRLHAAADQPRPPTDAPQMTEVRRDGTQSSYIRPDTKSQVSVRFDDDGTPLARGHRGPRRRSTPPTSTARDHPRRGSEGTRRQPRDSRSDLLRRPHRLLPQPHRQVRPGRPSRRHRPHGPQDHRRHLRWLWDDTAVVPSPERIPSKVDRSAAYMARYMAQAISLPPTSPRSCEVQLAYAIGVAEPVSRPCRYLRYEPV